jgi:putative redox protein
MNTDPVKVTFKEGFVGEMSSPTGTIALGRQENGMMPYHLLYGALASCFYATFIGITEKMRITFEGATIDVSGTKRDEVPTTLDYVKLILVVVNPSDEEKMKRAAELGAKHCSVYETLSKVANMDLEVHFETK